MSRKNENEAKNLRNHTIVAALIAAAIVAADQATKAWALRAVGIGGSPIEVVRGFFYIVCHRNSGAAFGTLQNGRYFLLAVTVAALIAIAAAFVKIKSTRFRIALAFAVGGALGNLVDRAFVGGVVDFLDFYLFGRNFPTFNLADMALTTSLPIAALFYVLHDAKKDGDKAGDEDS